MSLQFCGLMTLGFPLWVTTSARLAGRFLINPVRYCKRVDRSSMAFPDPVPGMKHITVEGSGGVKLHVATHGLGSGKPLMLFVHGFPETWASWEHQIKEFAGQYEVAALDMRGFGDSGVPKGLRNYTLDKLSADVVAVVHACGHSKCILVAHDWGGTVAWYTAVQHPQVVDKLVVLSCPHPAAFRDPQRFCGEQLNRSAYIWACQYRVAEKYLRHGDFRELERLYTGKPIGAKRPGAFTEQNIERLKAAFAKPGRLTAALNYYRASLRQQTKWARDYPDMDKMHFTPITTPTLVLYGDSEHIFLPQMFKGDEELIVNLTTACLPGCSHWVEHDRPEAVHTLMRTFLAGAPEQVPGQGARPASGGSTPGFLIKAKTLEGPRAASPLPGTPRLVAKQA